MTYAGAAAATSQARANARDVAFIRGGSGTGIGFYRAYSPALGIRFQSTQNSERVVFMFAEDEASSEASRFNIVAVDKKDGSEAGRLASDSRRPDYSMDTSAARLFVKAGDNEIAAYAFSVK